MRGDEEELVCGAQNLIHDMLCAVGSIGRVSFAPEARATSSASDIVGTCFACRAAC